MPTRRKKAAVKGVSPATGKTVPTPIPKSKMAGKAHRRMPSTYLYVFTSRRFTSTTRKQAYRYGQGAKKVGMTWNETVLEAAGFSYKNTGTEVEALRRGYEGMPLEKKKAD